MRPKATPLSRGDIVLLLCHTDCCIELLAISVCASSTESRASCQNLSKTFTSQTSDSSKKRGGWEASEKSNQEKSRVGKRREEREEKRREEKRREEKRREEKRRERVRRLPLRLLLGLSDRRLEVKLPTIWTDGKAEVGRGSEDKKRSENLSCIHPRTNLHTLASQEHFLCKQTRLYIYIYPLPCNSDHNWTAQTEHHKNVPN